MVNLHPTERVARIAALLDRARAARAALIDGDLEDPMLALSYVVWPPNQRDYQDNPDAGSYAKQKPSYPQAA